MADVVERLKNYASVDPKDAPRGWQFALALMQEAIEEIELTRQSRRAWACYAVALKDQRDQARETNRTLNRRCQEADAALPSYKRLLEVPPNGDGLRFVNGNLGRALLRSLAGKQQEEIGTLRAANEGLRRENERNKQLLENRNVLLDDIIRCDCELCMECYRKIKAALASTGDAGCMSDSTTETTMTHVDSTSDERTVNNIMRHQYRVLSDAEKAAMQAIKDKGLELYELIGSLGESREVFIAQGRAEEAVMWAVKHITR